MATLHRVSEIVPGLLYLGDAEVARDVDLLESLGVRSVLNATVEVPCYFRERFEYLRVPWSDDPEEPVLQYAYQIVEFVGRAMSAGEAVLVHCRVGVSRSVTAVLMYLIKAEMMSLREAVQLVVDSPHQVYPNVGLWRQLIKLERDTLGCSSISALAEVMPQHS